MPHTHGSATHDHDTDHHHDETATVATASLGPEGLALRIAVTLLGALGMIVGAFLEWFGGTSGVELRYDVLYRTAFDAGTPFVTSVGFVVIVLAVLALVGLASSTGGLTRAAGALGIAAFVLFAIQVYRVERTETFFEAIQIGAWLVFLGSLVTLVAGFFGTEHVVDVTD